MFAYLGSPGKALSPSRPLLEAPIPTVSAGGPRGLGRTGGRGPMKRALLVLLPLALAALALPTILTIPASAQKERVMVRMPDGTVQQWIVNAPDGATLQDIKPLIPQGEPISIEPVPQETQTTPPPAPPKPAQPEPQPKAEKPSAGPGERQKDSGDRRKVAPPKPKPQVKHEA